jgi:hypothetical protein
LQYTDSNGGNIPDKIIAGSFIKFVDPNNSNATLTMDGPKITKNGHEYCTL